jgi:hypothetical protein
MFNKILGKANKLWKNYACLYSNNLKGKIRRKDISQINKRSKEFKKAKISNAADTSNNLKSGLIWVLF